eukprot:Skav206939  [mRNA]  locus=scaffold1247:181619:182188:+ [translate_table: standard]
MKNHLKREDGVRELTKRSMKVMGKKLESFETVNSPPARLLPSIQPIQDRLNDLKNNIARGDHVILKCLESIGDDKLNDLKHIFSRKGAGANTEDKLLRSIHLLSEDLTDIDGFVNYLHQLKAQIVETYVDTYSNHYSFEKTDGFHFNNEAFIKDLEGVVSYRRGLRRATENAGVNDNLINQDANSCILM